MPDATTPIYDTTTRYALRYLREGANLGYSVDNASAAIASDVDALLTPHMAGALASRPPSSLGAPSGKAGRTYRATDTGLYYLDSGFGWVTLAIQNAAAAFTALNATSLDVTNAATFHSSIVANGIITSTAGLASSSNVVANATVQGHDVVATVGLSGNELHLNGSTGSNVFSDATYFRLANGTNSAPVYASAFTTFSDERIKHDIEPLTAEESLEAVQRLRPVEFTLNGADHKSSGFIAQDVEKVPGLGHLVETHDVSGQPEFHGNLDEVKTLDLMGLLAPLTGAVQALAAENQQLRDRVEKLEAAAV